MPHPSRLVPIVAAMGGILAFIQASEPVPAAASLATATLPFSMKITEVPLTDGPGYLWKGSGVCMDFNAPTVRINDEFWSIYANGDHPIVKRWKGTTALNAKPEPDGRLAFPPEVRRPYMLGGMWYDARDGILYAPLHCEYNQKDVYGFTRQIHLATSKDKGLTWTYAGPIVTRYDDGGAIRDGRQNRGQRWDGGLGDQFLFVDERTGYAYLYALDWSYTKHGMKGDAGLGDIHRYQVARCALADKLAPGKWRKFHNSAWTEPGVGGKGAHVPAYTVTWNEYLKKYVSFNFNGGLSVCTDLERQDWTPRFLIDAWGRPEAGSWGFLPVNEAMTDTKAMGQVMYLMRGWVRTQSSYLRLEFGPGETKATNGFVVSGGSTGNQVAFDPKIVNEVYARVPSFDSGDPIESRRTRPCTEADHAFSKDASGKTQWRPQGGYQISDAAGAQVKVRFTGSAVYWRAAMDKDSGLVDVVLDDEPQGTIDLYSPTPTDLFIPFYRTGLDPKRAHTIVFSVRGEKNARSAGTAVKHRALEHAVETYVFSDGFSARMGADHWHYLYGKDGAYQPMSFPLADPGRAFWSGEDGSQIGVNFLKPGTDDAVLQWLAPHAGHLRIEAGGGSQEIQLIIRKNQEERWKSPRKQACDQVVQVSQGDAILFIARRVVPGSSSQITCIPRVTYVDQPTTPDATRP